MRVYVDQDARTYTQGPYKIDIINSSGAVLNDVVTEHYTGITLGAMVTNEILGTKYLILNYESDSLLDISAIFALEDIIIRLNNQKIKLMLIIKNDDVRKQLKDLNIVNQIGENHIFYNELDAINLAKTCIKTKIKRHNKKNKKNQKI